MCVGSSELINIIYSCMLFQWPKLMDAIKIKVTDSINAICNSVANFSQCCPNSGSWAGVVKTLVSTDSLITAQSYPVVLASGEITGIINFIVKKDNALCPKGKSTFSALSMSTFGISRSYSFSQPLHGSFRPM